MDIKEKLVRLIRHCTSCEECRDEDIADHLIVNGVTFAEDINVPAKWIPVTEPPKEYRDEYGELIPFLVCLDGTVYPFRAMYDGKVWGDGWAEIPVKYWMPLPEPPKGE